MKKHKRALQGRKVVITGVSKENIKGTKDGTNNKVTPTLTHASEIRTRDDGQEA